MPTDLEIRQGLFTQLDSLSTEKLTKLVVIGESIMSPLDTELTSVDFASMIQQVFKSGGLADRYYPEWTDRSKSDFGRFLVELFAIFSDKDLFYINHYSKEAFLGVAEEYRSIFHKAFHQGFNPPSNISASGDVELLFSAGVEEIVPRGTILLGVAEMPDLVYTNEEFTIPNTVIDTGVTAVFKHGRIRSDNGFFDGYSILIDTTNIADESVRLLIDGVEWDRTENFLLGTISTKHFMVVYANDGKAEILFAKDGLGAVPDVNQEYVVEYRVGGGYIGDIGADVLNLVVTNGTVRNLQGFTQFQMVGGNNRLPLENLRHTVVGKQRHQNRVVTPEDVRYFCEELSFVRKVYSEAFLNFVYIYVLPIGGGDISPSQRTLVEQKIKATDEEDRKLLMGFNLNVSGALFVPLKIVCDIYLLPTTIKSSAMIKATQTLQEILDPLKDGDFGDGFNRSKNASKLLQRITGSTNVVFSTIHRLGLPAEPNDITFISRELVDYEGSEITINLIGGI